MNTRIDVTRISKTEARKRWSAGMSKTMKLTVEVNFEQGETGNTLAAKIADIAGHLESFYTDTTVQGDYVAQATGKRGDIEWSAKVT